MEESAEMIGEAIGAEQVMEKGKCGLFPTHEFTEEKRLMLV